LCVFWYHSPNVLDTLHICNISWLRVKVDHEHFFPHPLCNITVDHLNVPHSAYVHNDSGYRRIGTLQNEKDKSYGFGIIPHVSLLRVKNINSVHVLS
jgi:hypothetical protein